MSTGIENVDGTRQRLTRAERQQRTRADLIDASERAFARDGYHGARLERIAADAGYSTGAIYSNFAGKSELYLAALDRRIDELQSNASAVVDAVISGVIDDALDPLDDPDLAGRALASMEFLATALRDPSLRAEIELRGRRLGEIFASAVAPALSDQEHLTADQVGALLFAFDQGLAIARLVGFDALDVRVITSGYQRLLGRSPEA